jgi:hypothetical protein
MHARKNGTPNSMEWMSEIYFEVHNIVNVSVRDRGTRQCRAYVHRKNIVCSHPCLYRLRSPTSTSIKNSLENNPTLSTHSLNPSLHSYPFINIQSSADFAFIVIFKLQTVDLTVCISILLMQFKRYQRYCAHSEPVCKETRYRKSSLVSSERSWGS